MILLALGANLPGPYGAARVTLAHAIDALDTGVAHIVKRSPWYGSRPVPASGQPDFVNGVVQVETALAPLRLLAALHQIEARFGRVRGQKNAARQLDLDLLAYDDLILDAAGIAVPHPRMQQRAFVLAPLCDIAPDWMHPLLGQTARQLYQALPRDAGFWLL